MTRLLLVAAVAIVVVLAAAGVGAGAEWDVDYTTIQAAVNAASAEETVEVRGNVVELGPANPTLVINTPMGDAYSGYRWDYSTFPDFWYDLDDGLSTETLTILALDPATACHTLDFNVGDRTLDENTLVYTTSPIYQQYELNENEGLVVDSDNPGGDAGYWVEGWMGEMYVAIDNNADKLTKRLVEFEDDDKKTLSTGESWDLGGGFALTAENLTCLCETIGQCDSFTFTLSLSKNGVKLDEQTLSVNASDDEQDRVYTYTPNIGGEEHVPVFSCYVDAGFHGTDSDIVQLMYVFLIDDDVWEIDTSETYGAMEVMTASTSQIVLRNNHILDLDSDTTEHIMGGMYFKTADDDTAIRFYPMVEHTEPGTYYEIRGTIEELDAANPTLTVNNPGAPVADQGRIWDYSEFGGFWYDLDDNLQSEQLKILAIDPATAAHTLNFAYNDRTLDENTVVYTTSPVFQEHELHANEVDPDRTCQTAMETTYATLLDNPIGLCVDSDKTDGDCGYFIEGWMAEEYVAIDGNADKLCKLLVEFEGNEMHVLYSDAAWYLGGGFTFELLGINDTGDKATLRLSKDGNPLTGSQKCIDVSTGTRQDQVYTYTVDVGGGSNVPIFSCYVDEVFKGDVSYVQLKYAFLIDDDVLEVGTGDEFGVMKATASATKIELRNKEYTFDLDDDSTEHIMGNMYFVTADDTSAIRFYPFVERTTPHIPETLTVNNSGGADYTSIQAAIHAAESRDTIMVYNGTYHENVRVNKQLTLIGIGMPVVDGGGCGSAIEVTADHCTIDSFMVIHGHPYGIHLYYSSNNMLINNTASNNSMNGIHLISSSNNTISSNAASNNSNSGIVLYESSNNNMLIDNTISNNFNPGIQIGSSSNNILIGNIASNTRTGIYLYSSSNNKLIGNTASNQYYGIVLLSSSNHNTLENNTANLNSCYGIHLYNSSDDNTLYHNDLIDNGLYNAHDSCTNAWDSGSEGNYYSDYTGNDTNRDGIGDDPYDIPGGESIDRYPLTGIRWLPPEITRSRLGINTHWNHWAEDLSICKEKIRNFGIVRDQAWWAGLETNDLTGSEWDHANWDYSYNTETLCGKEITYQSGLDNLVKLYQDEDSPELLLLLNLKNDNISSFETITADQYYDYVYHVVERYDRDGVSDMPGLIRPVRYFEVGNEVDYTKTGDSRHGYLSPEDYVEKRLIPAYNAAKAANKDAIVMGSGLGMESDLLGGKTDEFNTAYLEAMYDNITANDGNKNNNFYMDKIAIHHYSENEHPEFFDENIKMVEDVIMSKEGREKPIWITEFAPASPPSLYARLLTLMFANKIEMPVIYNLKDDSVESFGLYDVTCVGDEETIKPRESIQVIDTVLSILHGTTPSETENKDIYTESGKTIYQRVFNNSDKKVTVLWYIDTADPGAVTNCVTFPESPQTFTVDVLGTADFSTDPSPIHLKIGSNPTYVVETDPPIDLDLYFNKTTAAGVATERATSFRVGDTLYGKLKTATSTSHTVKTYITMTMPDGTCRYAHYDKPDFDPGSDKLLFSDTKIQLYDGVWSATTNDWLWNIYEFTGGDSGIYRWNCWYEDAETGEILGGDSAEYTFSETPSGTPVESATGGGKVYLDSSAGAIENIAAIPPDAMPEVPESLNPVYGFFSFEITGISSGESVNIPLAFPENVPTGTEYWKYGPTTDDNTPHWYQIPVSDDDGDRIIVITLTDGGIGDDDLAVNGVIVDDGGPSLPKKGDLNHDSRITSADAAIALQLAATGAQNPAADVSGDDRVTSLDALMILQAAAERIEL